MKRYCFFLCLLLLSLTALAQVSIKEEDSRFGIYNSHTKRWEVEPVHLEIRDIGIYDGRQYFAVCRTKDRMWGVIRSDDFKYWYRNPIYTDVECSTNSELFSSIPILCVQERSGWGIVELGTGEFWYIRKSQYKSIRLDAVERKVYCQSWDASVPDEVLYDYHLKKAYDYILSQTRKHPVTLAETNSSDAQVSASRSGNRYAKPTCEILSPATGSTFTTSTVRLRYTTNLAPENYTIHFLVNGAEVEPIPSGTDKGARVVQGKEVELPMPANLKLGSDVIITIRVHDDNGIWADPKSITMMYTGEVRKPTLHIFAVGISEYPAADLQDLKYAAKDAQDFVKAVTHSNLQMYSNINPVIILNQDATADNIRTRLTRLSRNVKQDDVVMLFFSGHGINENEDRFFLTYNVSSVENYVNGVEFSFIRKRMKDMVSKNSHVIVFLDACHSGAMAGTKGTAKGITLATPGVIGYYSSTADQKSAEIDNLENGVFTKAILNALDEKIAKGESEITAQQLWDYIVRYVGEQTNNNQSPIYENEIGEYILLHFNPNNP